MDYRETSVTCPRCQQPMEWTATTVENPHLVDYHCISCHWKGDYDHLLDCYDEYSSEDYVFSENWKLSDALERAKELNVRLA